MRPLSMWMSIYGPWGEEAPSPLSIPAGATPTHRLLAASGSPACGQASPDRHRRCAAAKALSISTRQLDGARSGCNTWRQWQEAPGERAANNAVISAEIEAVLEGVLGFLRLPADPSGTACIWPPCRAASRRSTDAPQCAESQDPQSVPPCAQASSTACGVVDNLLLQDFHPPAPNLY